MDPKVVFDRQQENLLNERLEELESDRTLSNTLIACVFLFIGIVGIWLHGLNVSRLMKLSLFLPPGLVTLHFHLALTNLGVISAFPFGAISTFYNQWMFGSVGCQIYAVEGMVCGMTTIALTCSICVLHWLDVTQGITFNIWFYRLTVALTWMFGIFWSIPPLFGYGKYDLEPHKTTCSLQIPPIDWNDTVYLIALTFLGYVVPVSLAALAYSSVIKQYCDEVYKEDKVGENTSKKLEIFGTQVKLNGWILVQNILTWLALGIMACWSFSLGLSDVNPRVFYIPQLLAKLGCATTPVAYLITMHHLKKTNSVIVPEKQD
ncbi:hypothetical protein FBUS_06198 [Fasciolopsis buskii]|uniref:G-protein coupled receptors family 1 profile domain-containing protein n=1 Tax=Fasciolopsis buskii TaxID=27845 RepID=A0A8E0RSA9_9TREM|nr:hypothetical protein FBUS_06198 [Fasciolopsis buski]